MRLINLVAQGAGLRQGDILKLLDAETAPYGAEVCVIITADCDLAQGKHYGHVLTCPIISASAYYEKIWCAKRLENFRDRIRAQLRKAFDELAEKRVLSSVLSDQALRVICATESAFRVSLSTLELSPGRVEELANLVATLEKCGTAAGPLRALVAASAHSQKKPELAIREKLFSDFRVELAKDAVDIVVLHDDLSGDDVVHVVLLRAPFSIPAQMICSGASSANPSSCSRVGTFAPEIKFLIAQRFGTLFSRVGMKSEIEIDRNAAIDLLRDTA